MTAAGKADRTTAGNARGVAVEVEISSEGLFQGAKTLAITHAGERYLLRITRQNKLILTK